MKMFNKIIMTSEWDNSKLKDCFFQAAGKDAEVEDGALVSIKEPRAHDLYTGMKDLNARNCTAFDADAPVYGFVDYVGVSHADVMGVNYRIGDKLAGCFPVAGEHTRVRMVEVGDEFYLGDDNFAGTPDLSNKYGIPEAGKTTLKVTNSMPDSGLCVEIEDNRDLIMGQVNEGSKLYRCRVVQM